MKLVTKSSSDGSPIVINLDNHFTEILAVYFSGSAGLLEIIQDEKVVFQSLVPDFGFIPFKYQTKQHVAIKFTPDNPNTCYLNVQNI